MYEKTVTYTDYNGVTRTESFLFNITKAEAVQFEMSKKGGISNFIKRISAAQSEPELIELFKAFLKLSYGVKSDDGRRFIKSDEIWEEFAQTEAYSEIFMELATNDKFANEFIHGVVPKDVRDKMIEMGNNPQGIPQAT